MTSSVPTPPATGMPETPPPQPPQPTGGRERFARPYELGVLAIIVVLDQVTKAIVRASLAVGETRTVIPGFLDLAHVQNTGAAFGLLNDVDFPYKQAVVVAMAAIALLAIALYGAQLGFHDRLARTGLAMILGGAVGNLLDRALVGHVVDFVDVYWRGVHFWAFNVADAAISVGAALIILDTFGVGRKHASHSV